MKKTLVLFTLLLTTLSGMAQDSKVSATLSYPITVGDNFLKDYKGYVDLGFQYRFVNFGPVNLGVGANVGFLGVTDPPETNGRFTAMLVQPKLFAEFILGAQGQFRPSLGLGYGFNRLKSRFDNTGLAISELDRTYEGAILNLGLAYHISQRIFILAQYDRAIINRGFDFTGDKSFVSRATLIKIGVGYNF